MEPKFSLSARLSQSRRNVSLHPATSSILECVVLLLIVLALSGTIRAQNGLPFQVSNPQNKKWSSTQAARIYRSACDLLARTIRPENPPRLHPQFRLILGAEHDEYMRDGVVNEIRLKSWDPEKFAEAVVLGAVREVMETKDLMKVAHQSVSLADATVSARELAER